MKWRGKIWPWFKRVVVVSIITLFLLEMAYRYQWVDFYGREWTYHNEKVEKNAHRVLVFGDSFTADPRAWLYMLRDSLPGQSFYNAALPGIGPETHIRLFNRRMEEVNPEHVIVQLYVGNDLYDIERPVNWSKHGFFRNLFWSVANDFNVLNFVNYRMGQTLPDDLGNDTGKDAGDFSPQRYSARTRMYIQGDAQYPASVIDPQPGDARMWALCAYLREMQANCPKKCRFTVLLIPHCTQVDEASLEAYRRMGAKIRRDLLGKNPWKTYFKDMEVIDPLEAMMEASAAGKRLYYPNDPHLNAEGNRVLMQEVAGKL
jgi:hypothetical protein